MAVFDQVEDMTDQRGLNFDGKTMVRRLSIDGQTVVKRWSGNGQAMVRQWSNGYTFIDVAGMEAVSGGSRRHWFLQEGGG